MDTEQIKRMAAAVATLSMDAVEKAKSGHPGMPMGMAEAATVLWSRHLKHDPANPDWPDRDRFILSAGHGSMLLYSLLYLNGYPGWSLDDLKTFRTVGSKAAGHPEYGHGAGIETTTGPLGQGISNAVGFAMAEAHLNAKFGDELVDHRTWTIAGDGCLMEGISQEAISLAGHLKLKKLCVLWDDNGITIDGKVSLSDSTDQRARFEASGWHTLACDGHDPEAVDAALEEAKRQDKPTLIACRTIIGRGATLEGTQKVHGSPLGDEGIAAARKSYGWTEEPFTVPETIMDDWRAASSMGREAHQAWADRKESAADAGDFNTVWEVDVAPAVKALTKHAADVAAAGKPTATRKASEAALGVINPALPMTLGGSADLTGSNNTRTADLDTYDADNYGGRYVHYGIREHGMAAAMNGLALHGGVVPYGGAFLVFADYMRPSLRLAALMGVRVIHVMTHDSIGLGEDGPTHQPVETLAGLRAIPNLDVWRPADAVETAEAWSCALQRKDGPSVLALTRQNIGPVRKDAAKNLSARGAYLLHEPQDAKATILASGSEVDIALAAKDRLAEAGTPVRVVSVPCLDLFERQSDEYRAKVLGGVPRVVVEAAVGQAWGRVLYEGGGNGLFVGMKGFGASGPYEDLYEHFGITPKAVVDAVRKLTKGN